MRISPDDFAAFLTVAALFLFFISFEKNNLFLALASGVTAGLAILAQRTALLILPSMALYTLFAGEQKWYRPRAWLDLLKKPYFLSFLAGALFISAHWFLRLHRVYGNPFFPPEMDKIPGLDFVGSILFLIQIPLFCPPFLFGYLSLKDFFTDKSHRAVLFLWLWIIPFILFFMFRPQEENCLFLVYPALAMLSARGLSQLQERFSRYFSKPVLAGVLAGAFLAATVAWSVPIGLETVFKQRTSITEPLALAQLFYHSKNLTVG